MFKNDEHQGRLVVIREALDLYADVSTKSKPGYFKQVLAGCLQDEKKITVWTKPEAGRRVDRTTYNFPILLDENYNPWIEANAYMLHLLSNMSLINRPTDELRRIASKLLDYRLFCESQSIDMLDFNASRPAHRPSYRYFANLQTRALTPEVVNQYTGTIYKYYEYLSRHWYALDMQRVDRTSNALLLIDSAYGKIAKQVTKRSQTKRTTKSIKVTPGFVSDDGEILRPLIQNELVELLSVLKYKKLSVEHHFITLTCLATGARKQSILTLKTKHIDILVNKLGNNESDTATISAGPGTGIDTKNNARLNITFPAVLVKMLKTYKNSSNYKNRREQFLQKYKMEHPKLAPPKDGELYLFISNRANCFYMGKSDQRYESTKSPPTGQVTESIKKKIFKHTGASFPKDFTFHWLRATFALELYKNLQPLVKEGAIAPGADITFIQTRLGHKNRATTENYLKLFKNENAHLSAQLEFENHLFENLLSGLE